MITWKEKPGELFKEKGLDADHRGGIDAAMKDSVNCRSVFVGGLSRSIIDATFLPQSEAPVSHRSAAATPWSCSPFWLDRMIPVEGQVSE